MRLPTPHVVGHRVATAGAPDRYGNATNIHADAVSVAVHSISGPTVDGQTVARDKDRDERVIMCPAPCNVAIDDVVVIDGLEFEVDKVHDWTKGPWFNPIAGVEINASREVG